MNSFFTNLHVLSCSDTELQHWIKIDCLIRMSRLNENQRGQALAFLVQGESCRQVARRFGVNHCTISRLRERLQITGSIKDRPGSGRPRETTRRQDRRIRLSHLRNRFLTAVETAANTPGRHNNRISPKTVRNRLND